MPELPLPRLTLVLGGARSGKSRYGEELVGRTAPPWTYVATAEAWDTEMAERIAHHRARRNASWKTLDAPLALADTIGGLTGPTLIDCLKQSWDVYKDKSLWSKLMHNAMSQDFSWEKSAKQYLQLYLQILRKLKFIPS